MRLNKTDREEFRKRVKILIPQMKNRERLSQTKLSMLLYIVCNLEGQPKTKTYRPTLWTPVRKSELKRLTI